MSALIPLPNLVDPSRVSPRADQVDDRGEERPRRQRPTPEELLEGLNPSQREAVTHEARPCSSWPARARARPGC